MSIASAYTSIRQIPAFVKQWKPEPGSTILDIGGGRFDDCSNYIATMGSTNYVFDPFNRTPEHNDEVKRLIDARGCDYIMCLNVINVIEQTERLELYLTILSFCSARTKTIFFQIYAGNGSGVKGSTVQNNMKAAEYIPEITNAFPHATITVMGAKRNIIAVSLK